MNTLATSLDPTGKVTLVDDFLSYLWLPVLQKFEVSLANLDERRAESSVRVSFLAIMNLESQVFAEKLQELMEIANSDTDMINFRDIHETSGTA